jgi:hypothetical protein
MVAEMDKSGKRTVAWGYLGHRNGLWQFWEHGLLLAAVLLSF